MSHTVNTEVEPLRPPYQCLRPEQTLLFQINDRHYLKLREVVDARVNSSRVQQELRGRMHKSSHRLAVCLERQWILEKDEENNYLNIEEVDRFAQVAKKFEFSPYAWVSAQGLERQTLDRLCRDITTPAVCEKRISLMRTGDTCSQLKMPYSDAVTHAIFEPPNFIAKLAALVPKPRVNLSRFSDFIAQHCKHRSHVTPSRREKGNPSQSHDDKSPRQQHWAQRLKRIFTDASFRGCGHQPEERLGRWLNNAESRGGSAMYSIERFRNPARIALSSMLLLLLFQFSPPALGDSKCPDSEQLEDLLTAIEGPGFPAQANLTGWHQRRGEIQAHFGEILALTKDNPLRRKAVVEAILAAESLAADEATAKRLIERTRGETRAWMRRVLRVYQSFGLDKNDRKKLNGPLVSEFRSTWNNLELDHPQRSLALYQSKAEALKAAACAGQR